jgi:hypothetical protein
LQAASGTGRACDRSRNKIVAIKTWPAGGWHTAEIFQEYNLALTRGVAGGRFLRWFEQAN